MRDAADLPLIVNLAPTGMLPAKSANPHLPVSPAEIAADVERCAALGASMFHLHARDENGLPTWKASTYEKFADAARKKAPQAVICLSTSGRRWPEFEKRSEVLALKPDMASLTLGSMNFPNQTSVNAPDMILRLLEAMLTRGVKPEFEIFEIGMIDWARDCLIPKMAVKPPHYFNLILASKGTASLSLRNLSAMVDALPPDSVWSVGGIGRFQLRANVLGVAMGNGVRLGIEDTLYMDAGKTALARNPLLVERIRNLAHLMGRPIATCEETRGLLGLSRR